MANLLATIQDIAVKAVKSTNPLSFVYGTVTSASPLKIRIDQSTIQLEGDSLILTSAVIEKKMVIQKHKHTESEELVSVASAAAATGGSVTFTLSGGPPTSTSLTLKHKHTINDTVLDAYVFEEGKDDDDHKLDVKKDDEKIVVTINRALKKDDKVVMLRVSSGQQFVVLSRAFEE